MKQFTVLGKQHLSGVSSKTGKHYDFCKVYYSILDDQDNKIDGQTCRDTLCSSEVFDLISPGDVFTHFYFDETGNNLIHCD